MKAAQEKRKILRPDQVENLLKYLRRRRSVRSVCRQFHLSRSYFYELKKRYRQAEGNRYRQLAAITPKDNWQRGGKTLSLYQIRKVLGMIISSPDGGASEIVRQICAKDSKTRISYTGVNHFLKALSLETKAKRRKFVLWAKKIKKDKLVEILSNSVKRKGKKLLLTPEERLETIRLAEDGASVAYICKIFHTSRRNFYLWHQKYKQAEPGKQYQAVSNRIPVVLRFFRQISDEKVQIILKIVIEHPEYSTHKIAQVLGWVGNHGVQNVLRRAGLNTYEKRLVYAQTKAPLFIPAFRFPEFLRPILARFPVIAPIPPPSWEKFSPLLRPFFVSLASSVIFSNLIAVWISTVSAAVSPSAFLGLIFASVSLTIGMFFFAYSMKYYLTIGLVLSFSRQTGEIGFGGEMGRGNGNGNGGFANLFRKIFGLNGPSTEFIPSGVEGLRVNGENGQEKILAGGLQPNLDQVKIGRYPFFSIHLPFYNEKNVAKRLIEACLNMDYPNNEEGRPNFEVVVCDDSTDETVQIISNLQKSLGKVRSYIGSDGESVSVVEPKHKPILKIIHRQTREGFKGKALSYAVAHMDEESEFVCVFDADFVPYADTLEQFLKYFKAVGGWSEGVSYAAKGVIAMPYETFAEKEISPQNLAVLEDQAARLKEKSPVAVVAGYQWHVLNKSENWITRGVRSEYAGSYVVERPGQEILGALKIIHGSVYCLRADVIKHFGWGSSITEDYELTLRIYEKGFRVAYTPYIQAPSECVSTLKRLIRQRMRWAEGHSFNTKRMFWKLLAGNGEWGAGSEGRGEKRFIPSPLTWMEKLEFLYLAPYYLQAAFFLVGTLSWLISETVFQTRLPFWTSLWGWSLVLTNLFALPLVNAVGLFLEEAEEKDYLGLFSFVALSYIVVPFQAYAAVKGFVEKQEGPWFRTPKTGKITDIFTRGRFYRWLMGVLPGFRPAAGGIAASRLGEPAPLPLPALNPYLALATANNRFNRFYIPKRSVRSIGRIFLIILLVCSVTISSLAPAVPYFVKPKEVQAAKAFGMLIDPKSDLASKKDGQKPKAQEERGKKEPIPTSGLPADNPESSPEYLPDGRPGQPQPQGENSSKEKVLKKDFRPDEEPELVFHFPKKLEEKSFLRRFFDLFRVQASSDEEIKAELFDDSGREIKTDLVVSRESQESVKITVPISSSFKPGAYKLKVEREEGGKTAAQERNFSWGVLAINVNKSTYLPEEEVYIQMAALDQAGRTLCNANLTLEITSPAGQIVRPEIRRSGECGPDNVTDRPDYFSYFEVKEMGIYRLRLRNPAYGFEITDSFAVAKAVPLVVERSGPTRIYPKASYEMKVKVKANRDFVGEIIETVPGSFEIINTSEVSPRQERGPSTSEVNGTKVIIWPVDWQKGEEYELKYQFDAPDVSPYLYLLGPLVFKSAKENEVVFKEARSWQVAADSPGTQIKTVEFYLWQFSTVSADNDIDSGYGVKDATWSDTCGDANDVSKTINLPESGITVRYAYVEWRSLLETPAITNGGMKFCRSGQAASTETLGSINSDTAESYPLVMRQNVTSQVIGGSYTYYFNAKVTGPPRSGDSAKLVITYEYSDTSTTQLKTVRYMVGARYTQAAANTTDSFTVNPNITDPSVSVVDHFVEYNFQAIGANATDYQVYAIMNGTNGDSVQLDQVNSTGHGYTVLNSFATANINLASNNTIGIRNEGQAANGKNAEWVITYTYTYYTSPATFTNTVRFFGAQYSGVELPTSLTAIGSANVCIPETTVTYKKVWLRINAYHHNGGTGTWGYTIAPGTEQTQTNVYVDNVGMAGGEWKTLIDITSYFNTNFTPTCENVDLRGMQDTSSNDITNVHFEVIVTYGYDGVATTTSQKTVRWFVGQDYASNTGSTAFTGNFNTYIPESSGLVFHKAMTVHYNHVQNYSLGSSNNTQTIDSTEVTLTDSTTISNANDNESSLNIVALNSNQLNPSPLASQTSISFSFNSNRVHTSGAIAYTTYQLTVPAASGGGINISGSIYQSGSETLTDSTGYTIAVSVQNATPTTTTASGGTYSFTGVSASSGNSIAVYIQGHANDGNTFTVTNGTTNITNLHLYVGRLAVENDNAGTTNNSNICNQSTYPGAGDKIYSCTGNNLTINSGVEFHLGDGESYDTGASATLTTQGTGDLHVDDNATATITSATSTVARDALVDTGATLTINASTNINGGDITMSGTSPIVNTTAGTPTVTMSGTGSIGGGTTPSITFYNLSTSGTGTTTIANTTTVNNNVSVGAGTTLTVGANLNIDGGGLTTTTTGIINYSGTPTVDIDGTGTLGGGSGSITFYSLDLGDGTVDTTTLSSTIVVDNNLTINASQTFTVGSNSVTVGSSVANSGGISVATGGSYSQTGGTTTVKSSSAGSFTLGGAGTTTFYNLTIGTASDNLSYTANLGGIVSVSGALTITDGGTGTHTLATNNNALNVAGNWTNNEGTSGFTAGTATVTLNGGGGSTQQISGSTNFSSLAATATTARTLKFESSQTQGVSGTLTFTGASAQLITLTTISGVTQWNINVSGSHDISYVDVNYSNATGNALQACYSQSTNNQNTNWTVNAGACETSTSADATAWSFQRKTFYDSVNSRYWKFFYDGDSIEGWYSADGDSWIDATNADLAVNTNDFSLWHVPGNTYVYIAYAISFDVRARRGTLSATDITWGTEYTPYNGTGASDTYSYPIVTRDSNNKLWITARHYGSAYSPFLYVYQEGEYQFLSDFIPGAISKDKEYTDYKEITDRTEVVDGKVRLKITEELEEEAFIDKVFLRVDGDDQKIIKPAAVSNASLSLILASDNQYLVMEQEDEHFLEFPAPVNYKKLEFVAEGYYLLKSPTLVKKELELPSRGVLAINTNKSIYLPEEKANLALAVLDEEGRMVCDAKLILKIKNQILNIETELSTENGTIKVNPECKVHGFTHKPDYETEYQVGGVGRYEMELTAKTPNGSYTINDSFEVRESVPFDIERYGPTRIYPPSVYEMRLKIKADQDFESMVEEYVPGTFELKAQNANVKTTTQNSKLIIWEVNWEAGETYELSYQFDAPDESPMFYLLGPIRLVDTRSGRSVFEEARAWQIAADAPDTVTLRPNAAGYYQQWETVVDTSHWGATSDQSDSTYIQTQTQGNIDIQHLQDPTFADSATVNSVTAYARIYAAGSGGPERIDFWERLTGTDRDQGNNTAVTRGSFNQYNGTTQTTAPDGGSWTKQKVTDLEVGIQAAALGGGETLQVAEIWIVVDYTPSAGIDISGSVKGTDESSFIGNPPCNGSTLVVSLRVDGGTESTIDCDDTTGNYSFTSVSATAGQTITIYLNASSTPKANLVMVAGSGNVTDANLFQDRVIARDEQDGTITILDMLDYDNTADLTNMLFDAVDATPDTLTVNSNKELHVWTGDTFDPGGTVTTQGTGNLHVDDSGIAEMDTATNTIAADVLVDSGATFRVNADTNINGGDITMSGTSPIVNTTAGTPTVTMSGTGSIGGGTTPSLTFYNLSTSGTGTTTIANTTTVNNNVSVGAGTTLRINANLSLDGGSLTTTTTGIIDYTSGTPTVDIDGTGTLGGGSGSITFYSLDLGDGTVDTTTLSSTIVVDNNLTINASQTFTVGSNSVTVGSSVANSGGISVATGGSYSQTGGTTTVKSSSAGSFTLGGAGTTTFYNLTIGVASDNLSYTANLGGIVSVSGTLTITDGGTGTHTLATNNNALNVAGNWTNSEGTTGFTAGTATVTLNGGGGTTQQISGSTNFSSLAATATTARTLKFESSQTQGVSGTLTFTGASAQLITLTTISGVTQWNINVTGSHSISYVDVNYSNATGNQLSACNSQTTYQNNTNWLIYLGACAASYQFKAIQSTTADDVSAWGNLFVLNESANSNKYGAIVPLNLGDMYAAFIDGTSVKGCFYDEQTSDRWEDSGGNNCTNGANQDSIDTGVSGLTKNLSAVVDTTNYDVHLLYIEDDVTDTVSYNRWDNGTGTNGVWQTEVTLDTADTDAYVTISIESNTRDLYAVWIDTSNSYIYYRTCDVSAAASECSALGDWVAETAWKTTGTNNYVTSNYSGASMIFAQWTIGSGSPYSIGWDFILSPGATSELLTAWSFQRKTFYDNTNSVYWRFSYDGTEIDVEYNSSPWDSSWTATTSFAENTNDFSLWDDDTYVFIAYYDTYDVRVMRGSLGPTSITWGSEYVALDGTGTSAAHQYAFISQDSSGYLWAMGRYYNGTNYYMRARKSSAASDPSSWEGTTYDLSDATNTDTNNYGFLSSLGSSNMYSVWIRGTAVEGKKYTQGTGWDASATSIGTGKSGLASNISMSSDTNNNLHLAYIDGSDYVQYKKYAASWDVSPTRLDTAAINEYVTVSVDSSNNDVYVIYLRSSVAYYKKYSGSWGGETDTAWAEGTAPKHLTSNYQDSGRIFAEWTSGSASPYSLNWNYIIIPEKLWLLMGLGLVIPRILKRTRLRRKLRRAREN